MIRSLHFTRPFEIRQFLRPLTAVCTTLLLACGLSLHPLGVQAQTAAASNTLSEAQQLLQTGRIDEAAQRAQQALTQSPRSVDACNLLGIIESTRHNFPAAIATFKRALDIAPGSIKTLNNLGAVYVQLNDLNQAEKQFREAHKLAPSDRDANYNLGVLLMAKGRPAQAIPLFLHVHPANLATQFNLVRAYLEAGQTVAALQLAKTISTENEKNLQVHFSLGLLLASQKQYAAAEYELEHADALQPNVFEIAYNLGQAYLRDGKYAQSGLALNRALRLEPGSVDAMYLMAQTYTNQAHPLDALDLLVRAHKIAPDNADVIFLMAQISMSQSYFEDAIPLLESGVKIAPKRADLIAALGESYFMAGNVDKAIEQFQHLVELDRSARSYSFLGLAYRNLGRFDEAKKYFDQGLALDPKNGACLFNLGFIAERQGNALDAARYFQQTLNSNPDYADALLELANLRIAAKDYAGAEPLLRRYVKIGKDPGPGYYKLAMVERSLHKTAEADHDLAVFKSLSKSTPSGPLPFQHLFDYLDNRAQLAPQAKRQLDLTDLVAQARTHPDQPQSLYLLAEAYLKAGDIESARSTVTQLDRVSAGDFRTLTGAGVLLARYRLYDDAIAHFQQALALSPNSDDIRFDLANALFRKREYQQALEAVQQVSPAGQTDNACLALLGDIQTHLGNTQAAEKIYAGAITRNPDSEQAYLSLALLHLRSGNIAEARQTLQKGLSRIPGSGTLTWGLGVTTALDGSDSEATDQLQHAIDLLPQWSAAYSTLGFYYFATGRVQKAKDVLAQFQKSSAHASLDIERIAQVLNQASAENDQRRPLENKAQFLQLVLSLADRTL